MIAGSSFFHSHTHAILLSQFTLPQRHLSFGKARWWMQVGGWYACAQFCVHLSVRVNGITGKQRGWKQYVLSCMCACVFLCMRVLLYAFANLRLCFFLSARREIFLTTSSLRAFDTSQRLENSLQRCYRRREVPPVLLRARPLSEQVADCGKRAEDLSVRSRREAALMHQRHTKHIRAPEWKRWRSWHGSTSNCVSHLFPGKASSLQ